MTRLHHTYAGYLRLMQMSSTQLYVFVEGKQCDPYFFAQVCAIALGTQVTYMIVTARQIPGDSGGKQALLKFFVYLRAQKSLTTDLGGQKTSCIFFLDKDVDDIQRKCKKSAHLVYTQHYDVQNYVFCNGDLTKGGAAAASVDPRRLAADLDDSSLWCNRVATLWKDWVALCLQMLKEGIPSEANYRVLSRVQTRPCGPTDLSELSSLTRDIARRANFSVAHFRRSLGASTNKVDSYLKKGDHHKIFKGKWFGAVLADDIDRIMAGDPYDKNGLSGRLPCAIAATLDFSEPWADHFKQPLQSIAAML